MTTVQKNQIKNSRPKSGNHNNLFKQHNNNMNTNQFQQIFQNFKKQTDQATKTYILKAQPKNCEPLQQFDKRNQFNGKLNQYPDKTIRNPLQIQKNNEFIIDTERKRLRALSNNKFDCLLKKSRQKRNKKLMPNLFEFAKINEKKKTNSKKSTDNSNSEQIEKVKAENQEIYQIIKKEEKRLELLQKLIVQEKKKHQYQKQIYSLSIQKLKKKGLGEHDLLPLRQINELRESFISIQGDREDYDSLSIQSN